MNIKVSGNKGWLRKQRAAGGRCQVAGLLVVNAHLVQDSSGEGFAVRLFRKGNQAGFVRALSDQPAAFVSGFGKVRPLECLFLPPSAAATGCKANMQERSSTAC
jgi:hypothetical protein